MLFGFKYAIYKILLLIDTEKYGIYYRFITIFYVLKKNGKNFQAILSKDGCLPKRFPRLTILLNN